MHDGVHGRLHARRGARMIAISNGGAIPDTALFNVILQPEGVQIATLDEHFAVDFESGRRDPAGKYKLAHPAHRSRGPGAGRGRARRAAQRAVLVRRSAAENRRSLRWRRRTARRDLRAHRELYRPATSRPRSQRSPPPSRGSWRNAASARRERSSSSPTSSQAAPCWALCLEDHHHRGAVLRRRRRNATGPACAVRRPHQQGLGPGAAQSASAADSTSNCRPRPPTTASTSRSPSSTAFHSPTCFSS